MLEPYEGEINEFFIDVFVKNPKIEEGLYVSYDVIIQTNNISFTASRSSVRRRYSEFVELYKLLTKEYPSVKPPSLPPKYRFKDHFHPAFIENRRQQLEEFLKKILSQKIYLSSKSLHLFLQSNLLLTDIKKITQGVDIPVESLMSSRHPLSSSIRIPNEAGSPSPLSHLDIEANADTLSAHSSTTDENTSTKSDNVTSEGKRVSFCNQVTVAQIILD